MVEVTVLTSSIKKVLARGSDSHVRIHSFNDEIATIDTQHLKILMLKNERFAVDSNILELISSAENEIRVLRESASSSRKKADKEVIKRINMRKKINNAGLIKRIRWLIFGIDL